MVTNKVTHKTMADYIINNFKKEEMVILVTESEKSETSYGYDTAEGMVKTLTDPEVCDNNEDTFYCSIGKAYVIDNKDIKNGCRIG